MAGSSPRRSSRARQTRPRSGRKHASYSDESADGSGGSNNLDTPATTEHQHGNEDHATEAEAEDSTGVALEEKKPKDEFSMQDGADDIEDGEEEGEEFGGSITRCVCGKGAEDESLGFMIQCENCEAWQHGNCMGFPSVKYCPDKYYCERCRPDLHPPNISRKRSRIPPPPIQTDVPESSDRQNSARSSSKGEGPSTKRGRSTMNSRDAAYDAFVKTGIVSPSTARSFFEEDERDRQNNTIATRKRRRRSFSRADEDGLSHASHSPGLEQLNESEDDSLAAVGSKRKRGTGESVSGSTGRRATRRSVASAVGPNISEEDNGNQSDEADSQEQAIPPSLSNSNSRTRRHHGRYPGADVGDDTGSNVDSMEGQMIGSPRPSKRLGSTPRKGTTAAAAAASAHRHDTRGNNGSRAGTPAPSDDHSHDGPARVRYPHKRMTMPEMRRRASSMLDYVGRIQVEHAEKEAAAGLTSNEEVVQVESEVATAGAPIAGEGVAVEGQTEDANPSAISGSIEEIDIEDELLSSMEIMDRLTRELMSFQQKFGKITSKKRDDFNDASADSNSLISVS